MAGLNLLPVLAVLTVLAVGLSLLWWARRTQRSTGLPSGAVVYSDTGAERVVHEPLVSYRYGLVGKPDYLVETGQGKSRMVLPLEVKSRKRPHSPHAGHVLQLATYCLLVEDTYGLRPSHGYLRYADTTLAIPFSNELRQAVIDAATDIRKARRQADVERNHHDAARCARCGYSQSCGPQALTGTQNTGTQGRQH